MEYNSKCLASYSTIGQAATSFCINNYHDKNVYKPEKQILGFSHIKLENRSKEYYEKC